MEEVVNNKFHHKIFKTSPRSETHWVKPPDGYVRFDVDGSRSIQGQLACGGVVRDENGDWILGFQQKLSFGPTISAEIQAIKIGLQICHERKFKKVLLFSDCLEALQLLFRFPGQDHPLAGDIEEVRSLLYSQPEIEVHHSFREALHCADILAKCAHERSMDRQLLFNAPAFCCAQIAKDRTQLPAHAA